MTYVFLCLMLVPILYSTVRHLMQREPSRTEGYVYGSAAAGLAVFFVLSIAGAIETTEGMQGVSILLSFAYGAMCMAALITGDN